MSNPRKRRFDPVRELNDDSNDDENLYPGTGIAPHTAMPQPYDTGPWQVQGYSMLDMPRQSQYHGPGYMNPARYDDSIMSNPIWRLLNEAAMFPLCNSWIL